MSAKARSRVLGGHEVLALHLEEQVQHVLVENFPGADLLLDHVEAGLLDVHPRVPVAKCGAGKGGIIAKRPRLARAGQSSVSR